MRSTVNSNLKWLLEIFNQINTIKLNKKLKLLENIENKGGFKMATYNSEYSGAHVDEVIGFVLNTLKNLFTVDSSKNGQFLMVQNGQVKWTILEDAEGVGF